MKTETKQTWLALTLVIALVTAAESQPEHEPSQVITLPNGDKYQLVGVTHGTRPEPPSALSNLFQSDLGSRFFPPYAGPNAAFPRYFFWFQALGTNAPVTTNTLNTTLLDAMLADQSGVVAGTSGGAVFESGFQWACASFPAIPKRSPLLNCYFHTSYGLTSPYTRLMTIQNPYFGKFPDWQPEPLPKVKKVGDLEVRLDKIWSSRPARVLNAEKPVRAQGTYAFASRFDLSVRRTRGTNEAWNLHSAELSDATGNVLRGTKFMPVNNLPGRQSDTQSSDWIECRQVLPGTLWPDETAWQVKLELKRSAGYYPEELITFRNVPLLKPGATNLFFMTNTLGQLQLVLKQDRRWSTYAQYHDLPKFHLEILGMPGDWAGDVVQVTSSTRAQLPTLEWSDVDLSTGKTLPERFYFLLSPANASTVDITWAVQKTHTVEFLVKPPKAE